MSSGSPTSRRRVREAVVQFLYAIDPADPLPSPKGHLVLDLLLEPLREKSTLARSKAVLHLQQGREAARQKLPDLLPLLPRLEEIDEGRELTRAVREFSDAEEAVDAALNALRHELNGNKSAPRLREGLEAARLANLRSRRAAARVSACRPAFPALLNLQKDALQVWERLAEPADRLELALSADPGSHPALRSVAKADRQAEDVTARVESYLEGIHSNLESIDRHLAEVVENFSPERLDRVDRAILRLAAYELLFDREVPAGVAIDEAIELARSFGTTNSPRFVNGVLDRLPRAPSS